MSDMTNYLERQVYEWMRGVQMPTPPGTLYVALFTVAPSETAAGTEVSSSGTAYTRMAVTLPASSAPGDGSGAIASAINFPTATGGGWGTVVAVALMDASSAGNALMWKAISPSVAVAAGDSLRFDAAGLSVTFN